MLESVLADVLTGILGQYLQGIDRDSVRFGAWSGLVELRGVSLRPEALAVLFETLGLQLPVTVEAGFIGLLSLQVPWKSIGTTPVQVHMEDITIIARPVRGDGSDDSELENRERRIKRAKLNTDDAVREASWGVSSGDDASSSSSWSTWLVSDQLRAKIVDNIQIHLKDINLRFEDHFSNPQRPYIASVACEAVRAVSVNEYWQEAFVERKGVRDTRKLLEIIGFRINWAPITPANTPGPSTTTEHDGAAPRMRFETAELLKQFVTQDALNTTGSRNSSMPILHSVDGHMRLHLSAMDKPLKNSLPLSDQDPAVQLDIRFPEVSVDLDDVQYACLLQTSVYFARLSTRGFRPKTAKARWAWAIDQLLPGSISRRERALRFTEKGIAEGRDNRFLYVACRKALLKARRSGVEEPKDMAKQLETIEDELSYEEVLAYRDWVDRRAETEPLEWSHSEPKRVANAQDNQGTTTTSFWRMLGYTDQETISDDVGGAGSYLPSTPQNVTETSSTDFSASLQMSSRLSLKVGFFLCGATLRLSQGGFPTESTQRVALKLLNLHGGLLYSTAGDLVVEAVLGGIEAWNILRSVPMVYTRSASNIKSRGGSLEQDHDSYPSNVTEAIESIRSGSNPAKDVLLEADGLSDEGPSMPQASHRSGQRYVGTAEPRFQELPNRMPSRSPSRALGSAGAQALEAIPNSTYRVTETEFLGNPRNQSGAQTYIAAFRFTHKSGARSNGESSKAPQTCLDVSVATLEAVVDGPNGSFLWGLRFWKPKGMVQDPIMGFLGAAAGARIAELRMELEEALLADRVPMQINAVIMAPRFILPGTAPSDPAFVVNMGTLGICTSDNVVHSPSTRATVNAKHAHYSNYVLTLDDLGVYFCPNQAAATSRDLGLTDIGRKPEGNHRADTLGKLDTTDVERIIRPFSLRFVLQSLKDSSVVQVAHSVKGESNNVDGNIAKVRIRGNIPGLSVILTLKAFQHLSAAAQTWNGESYRVNVAESRTEHDTSSWNASHLPFTTQGGKLLSPLSDRPPASQTTPVIDEVRNAEKRPGSIASYDVKVLMQKVTVDIRQTSDSRLITATADRMITSIVKTGRKHVSAEFSLRSFAIIDGSRGSTAAFRRLMYAGRQSGQTSVSPPRSTTGNPDISKSLSGDDEDFVSIRYKANLLSNEQKVSFRFLSLNMVCVRETYVRIGLFFKRVREYVRGRRKRRNAASFENKTPNLAEERRSVAFSISPSFASASSSPFQGAKLSVESEFDGFRFQFVASGGAIAVVEMKDSRVYLRRNEFVPTRLWGDFRYFSVRDLTAPVDEHIPVVTYERPSLAVERMMMLESSKGEQKQEAADDWNITMPSTQDGVLICNAAFRNIKILFLSRFSQLMSQYVAGLISELHPVLTGSLNDADCQMRSISVSSGSFFTMRVDMELRDLSVRVPRHSGCATEALNLRISRINLANSCKGRGRSEWEVSFRDLQMATEYMLLSDNAEKTMSVSSTFLTGVDAIITLGNDVGSKSPNEDGPKRITVKVITPVRVNLCEAQYTVLYFVLTENFAETISGVEVSTNMLEESTGLDAHNIQELPLPASSEREVSTVSPKEVLENPTCDIQTSRSVVFDVSIGFLGVEISRGWDVTQESCKILGAYLKDVGLQLRRSEPYRLVLELEGHIVGVSDLRPGTMESVSVVIPLTSRKGSTTSSTRAGEDTKGNLSITYDKEGSKRPSIVAFMTNLQVELALSLFRDLTFLAVPGWPFLQSSSFAPEIVYLGRTMNVLLSESQVLLRVEGRGDDRGALALTGEFLLKIDWKRLTGAKRVSLRSTQVEISTIRSLPEFHRLADCYGIQAYSTEKLRRSESPLAYPTDSFVEYVGPDVDELGRRIEVAVDAFLCVVCAAEIPLLKAVALRVSSQEKTYLTSRDWVQPTVDLANAEREENSLTPKEKQLRKARESVNISVNIPAARYLFTDDIGGRFVPILEARASALTINAHGENMVQVAGELSLDLFNSDKGWWEPAVETWSLTASMSRGQSGTQAFVVRSEKRLNINITPTTVTASLAVASAMKSVAKRAKKAKAGVAQSSGVQKLGLNQGVRRPSVAAFLVRNELGIPVNMSLPLSSRRTTIANNTEVEVGAQSESLLASTAARDGRSTEKALRCTIMTPSSKPVEVSASEIGIHTLLFFPSQEVCDSDSPVKVAKPINALWDVRMNQGVPVCTLRSIMRFGNQTETILEIRIRTTPPVSGLEEDSNSGAVMSLKPGDFVSIPLGQVGKQVMVRPRFGLQLPGDQAFAWSAPLPNLKWLKKVAHELAHIEHGSSAAPSTMGMRLKRAKHTAVCKSKQKNACDFFVSVIPKTSVHGAVAPVWVDVAFKAPFVLENKLPGPLAYRVFQRHSLAVFQPLESPESNGAVLAAGVVEPLHEAHMHFSRESSHATLLSLAYENRPISQTTNRRTVTPIFGSAVNIAELNPGKVSGIRVSQVNREETRGQARREFRASLLPSADGNRMRTFAAFWVRNRSDTGVDICSRTSFYGSGSVVCFLRERPPFLEPDNYICCEGPYLSIRLPQDREASGTNERPEHSNWWTSPSTLDDIGKPMTVVLPGRSLELEVRPSAGIDCQTYVVTIRNTTWIVNSTPSVLQWCQASALDAHGNCRARFVNSLHSAQSQGIHWEAKSFEKSVHFRLADSTGQSDWIWSPAVPMNIGFSRELPAKMYRPKTYEQYIARVTLKEIAGQSKALVVFEEDRQNPPYRIINLCEERAIAFRQTGSEERHWLVRAGKRTRYSWDDPLAPPKGRLLSVRVLEKEELLSGRSTETWGGSASQRRPGVQNPQRDLNIDIVGTPVAVSGGIGDPVVATVSVDGATKVVTFREGPASDRQGAGTSLKSSKIDLPITSEPEPVLVVGWEEMKQKKDEDRDNAVGSVDGFSDYPRISSAKKVIDMGSTSKKSKDAALFLESIGISVVDSEPCEIIYIRYSGVLFNYQSQGHSASFCLRVKEIQVDNQLYKTPFPVMMWVSPPSEEQGGVDSSLAHSSPSANALAIQVHRDVARDDILMITSFQAVLRGSNVYIEDGLITRAIQFLSESALVKQFSSKEVLTGPDVEYKLFLSLTPGDPARNQSSSEDGVQRVARQSGATSVSRRIYVHDFKISPSSLRLTSAGSGSALAKAAGMPPTVRTAVGMLLNVDNCEFSLHPLSVQNAFDSLHHFAVLVREYYVAQLAGQRMKLLASNSLVGNPAALFDAVGTGARDFFSEPGRAKGSADFIASVGRGSKSLFAHTVGGIVESVSGIPRAVSSGIEAAVGDNDYLAERQRIRGYGSRSGNRGSPARNPAQGLATGAMSFAHGISSGVHGFIREPVQGAKQGGAGGLLKGIGKAFIGGVAKPVAGAIDLVAEPAAGLSRQIGGAERSRHEPLIAVPDRPPRAFRGNNPRLEAYDRRYSLGAFIYSTVQTVSGVSYNSYLVDWVELSRRSGRSSEDSELWVWNVVQQFVRYMPGSRKQSRKDGKQPQQGRNNDAEYDYRPEKTRIALLTETDVIIATLDCKLVTVVPLWEEAIYSITGDGKELVVTAEMPGDASAGRDDSSSLLLGAQSLISAPWDASAVGKRKKPAPGSQTIDRIACGSFEARDELRRLLGDVIKSTGFGHERYRSWYGSAGKRCSGVELTSVENWTDSNETEMRSTRAHERLKTGDIDQFIDRTPTSRKGVVEKRQRNDKIRTAASLERTVRRLSSGSQKGDSRQGLRMILANKLPQKVKMVLDSSSLDRGQWRGHAPSEICALDAQMMEVDGDERDGSHGKEVSGAVVYNVVQECEGRGAGDDTSRATGQVVLEFFLGKDEAASFTTRATRGYLAEFASGSGGQGTAIFTISQTAQQKGARAQDGGAVRMSEMEVRNEGGEGYALGSSADAGSQTGEADSKDGAENREGLSDDERLVQQLVEIGFKFEDAVAALADAGGDMVKAVDILTK